MASSQKCGEASSQQKEITQVQATLRSLLQQLKTHADEYPGLLEQAWALERNLPIVQPPPTQASEQANKTAQAPSAPLADLLKRYPKSEELISTLRSNVNLGELLVLLKKYGFKLNQPRFASTLVALAIQVVGLPADGSCRAGDNTAKAKTEISDALTAKGGQKRVHAEVSDTEDVKMGRNKKQALGVSKPELMKSAIKPKLDTLPARSIRFQNNKKQVLGAPNPDSLRDASKHGHGITAAHPIDVEITQDAPDTMRIVHKFQNNEISHHIASIDAALLALPSCIEQLIDVLQLVATSQDSNKLVHSTMDRATSPIQDWALGIQHADTMHSDKPVLRTVEQATSPVKISALGIQRADTMHSDKAVLRFVDRAISPIKDMALDLQRIDGLHSLDKPVLMTVDRSTSTDRDLALALQCADTMDSNTLQCLDKPAAPTTEDQSTAPCWDAAIDFAHTDQMHWNDDICDADIAEALTIYGEATTHMSSDASTRCTPNQEC